MRATGANTFCPTSGMPLLAEKGGCCRVFMLTIKTCCTRNNENYKTEKAFKKVGWILCRESGGKAGCEESVNFSSSAPVFASDCEEQIGLIHTGYV